MQRYLILVAMDIELEAVLRSGPFDLLPAGPSLVAATYRCATNSKEVLVACSGVGLVQAALTLVLIHHSQPLDGVISLGVAGALDPALASGALVVCTTIIQHDCIISSDAGTELMCPGELHLSVAAAARKSPVFICDPNLTRRLSPHTAGGLLLSGNEFVGNKERKMALARRHAGAQIVDMESAGIAQVARRLGLPLAALKTVADPLDHTAAASYLDFREAAAANAARVIGPFLRDG